MDQDMTLMREESQRYLTNAKRVRDFAFKSFEASGRTKWPTVRRVSRGLRLRQAEVVEFTDEGIFKLMLTSFSGEKVLGDHFIEINEPF